MKHETLNILENDLEKFKKEGFCSQKEIEIINTKINKINELDETLNFDKYNLVLNKNIDFFNNYDDDLLPFVTSFNKHDLIIATYIKLIDKNVIDDTFSLTNFEDAFFDIIEKFGLIYLEPIDKDLVGV